MRDPPADPSEMQVMGAARTSMWPVGKVPLGPPKRRTRRSRASIASMAGQGWFGLHVPSISRAATPAILTRGPSAHQIGPSPSHTATGVQVNEAPADTISSNDGKSTPHPPRFRPFLLPYVFQLRRSLSPSRD